MTMPATVRSLPGNETQETIIDFLRRLASMMTGGRNAEMLLAAATAIETLSQHTTATEAQLAALQDDHGKNLEQRAVAERAANDLLDEISALKEHLAQSQAEGEMAVLKTQLVENEARSDAEISSLRLHLVDNLQQAETEVALLRTELAEQEAHAKDEIASLQEEVASLQNEIAALQADIEQRDRLAEIDRHVFTEEAERLRMQIQDTEESLANISAATEHAIGAIDDSVAVVPVQALQLARTQFGYLAKAFEANGDVISLTLCEIGAQALDKALTGAKE